jgi:hypothetical protein
MLTIDERFDAKWVDSLVDCHLWIAAQSLGGYGNFRDGDKSIRAHRWAWERRNGWIPEGLVLDHICCVRHCVNPDHLELVTQKENLRRGVNWNRIKTHCTKGHEYSEKNTSWVKGGTQRRCKSCAKNNDKRKGHSKKTMP